MEMQFSCNFFIYINKSKIPHRANTKQVCSTSKSQQLGGEGGRNQHFWGINQLIENYTPRAELPRTHQLMGKRASGGNGWDLALLEVKHPPPPELFTDQAPQKGRKHSPRLAAAAPCPAGCEHHLRDTSRPPLPPARRLQPHPLLLTQVEAAPADHPTPHLRAGAQRLALQTAHVPLKTLVETCGLRGDGPGDPREGGPEPRREPRAGSAAEERRAPSGCPSPAGSQRPGGGQNRPGLPTRRRPARIH